MHMSVWMIKDNKTSNPYILFPAAVKHQINPNTDTIFTPVLMNV